MKKIVTLLLALVMICSLLSVGAFAEDPDPTFTIATATTDTHTYEVYQIFTGDLAADGKTLSNIKWGENAKLPSDAAKGDLVSDDVLEELKALTSSTNDQAKLAVIEKYVNFSSKAADTVTKSDSAEVAPGYYLLKDLGVNDGNGNFSVPDGQEYSEYITEIVADVNIAPKKDDTSVLKKVAGEEKDTNGDIIWKNGEDYDIGDTVDFQLSTTITTKYDNYQTYYFAFHDEQSEGLTFNPESVKVTVDGYELANTQYSVVTTDLEDDCTFEIVFADLKNVTYEISGQTEPGKVKAGSVIVATYNSTLNTGAVTGDAGNPNTVYGEFSNNPNSTGTGDTPKDTAVVFTYRLDANKVEKNPVYDPENTSSNEPEYIALKGAGFTLYKQTGMTEATTEKPAEPIWTKLGDEVKGTDLTTFTWKGVDAGTYKLVETTTPDGYNTMADIIFTITSEISDAGVLTDLTTDKTTEEMKPEENKAGFETDIVNEKGTILPETGGIGTTIFYVLGGVLLVGAAVLLITKKKMSNEG